MLWSLLTVGCYTISSLGDKYISSKLKCSPAEFTFLVSASTALWISFTLPFTGWSLTPGYANFLLLAGLVLCKIGEFFSSAILLRTVSAYELKAWLGINILFSCIVNIIQGKNNLHPLLPLFALVLLLGIVLIIKGLGISDFNNKADDAKQKDSPQPTNRIVIVFLSIIFIVSKFLYGLLMGRMKNDCNSESVLFIVMIICALIQIPRLHLGKADSHTRKINKKELTIAVATRIPNAAGLITESFAAMENIFLYACIQPIQFAILFLISLFRHEKMSRCKLAGSVLSLAAIICITIITI